MIKNGNIILSQSIIKDLGIFVINDQVEEFEWCPSSAYHKHIVGDAEKHTSQVMLEGLYAETILLGSCARGESIEELPEKKRGGATAANKRIDIQMQRMYGYLYAMGVRLNEYNKQIPLIAKYATSIWFRGELDIFPATFDGKISIIDAKTTKDINNTFFTYKEDKVRMSTNSCWGDFDHICKNQPLGYHFLARNFKSTTLDGLKKYNQQKSDSYEWLFNQEIGEDVGFVFVVAGTGKPDIDDQMAHHKYDMTPMREILFEMMIRQSVDRIQDGLKGNFKTNPKKHLCNACGYKNKCIDVNN